jgi:hypothetical protein
VTGLCRIKLTNAAVEGADTIACARAQSRETIVMRCQHALASKQAEDGEHGNRISDRQPLR